MTPLDPALRARLLDPPTGLVDVVLDTDATNEIDDQFALVWALLRPDRLRVVGLHAAPYSHEDRLVSSGSLVTELEQGRFEATLARWDGELATTAAQGVARAAQECRDLVALVGSSAPVLDGSATFLPDGSTPVRSPAAEHLIELAHQDREHPLQVLAIGAATNVASALLLDPTIRERLVVVWTSAYPSFWPYANASFNLAQDVPAARVLLESGVPFTYLPGYYVGEQLRVSLPELEQHVRGRGPAGDYLYALAAGSPFLGPGVAATKVIWDLINVAWALEPDWLTTGLVPTPRLTDDLRWAHGGPDRHLMREAWGVDRDAVFGDLFRVLAASAC
jgi:inosine-uridine nucleoside N-ribohydrolase